MRPKPPSSNSSKFHDRYEAAIVAMIAEKKAGLPVSKQRELPRIVAGTDLMSALRQSIEKAKEAELKAASVAPKGKKAQNAMLTNARCCCRLPAVDPGKRPKSNRRGLGRERRRRASKNGPQVDPVTPAAGSRHGSDICARIEPRPRGFVDPAAPKSEVSIATITRLEAQDGPISGRLDTVGKIPTPTALRATSPQRSRASLALRRGDVRIGGAGGRLAELCERERSTQAELRRPKVVGGR